LILLQRRPRSRAEDPVDRTGVIAEIAQRALRLENERRPRRSASPSRAGAVVVAGHHRRPSSEEADVLAYLRTVSAL
jgi:hypothetical protein